MSVPASHRDLIVWQKAVALAEQTYRVAARLPRDERFELGAQMRRAAISIACNIAEGKGRARRGDYARFLSMARGSVRELDTHLELARRLALVPADDAAKASELAAEVSRMLTGMLRKLTPTSDL